MKKIVVLGGGTGSFVVLSGLKNYPVELTAIVSMADDGGSTGILRDELGVLPPGDVRQCLVALSDSSRLMRSLMNYRFCAGGLQGHSFGNILLSALEKVTGSFEKAVEETGKILSIRGKVLPVTTHRVRLKMLLNDGILLEGEGEIYTSQKIDAGFKSVYLEPIPVVNQRAIDELMNADLIIFGPGGLYTSLIPNLLVDGISKALRETKAKKVFIANLMNRKGQTTNFTLSKHLFEIERFIGEQVFDYVLCNDGNPPESLLQKYAPEASMIVNDLQDNEKRVNDTQDHEKQEKKMFKIIAADLLDKKGAEYAQTDKLAMHRALIRHDPEKIAEIIMQIVKSI